MRFDRKRRRLVVAVLAMLLCSTARAMDADVEDERAMDGGVIRSHRDEGNFRHYQPGRRHLYKLKVHEMVAHDRFVMSDQDYKTSPLNSLKAFQVRYNFPLFNMPDLTLHKRRYVFRNVSVHPIFSDKALRVPADNDRRVKKVTVKLLGLTDSPFVPPDAPPDAPVAYPHGRTQFSEVAVGFVVNAMLDSFYDGPADNRKLLMRRYAGFVRTHDFMFCSLAAVRRFSNEYYSNFIVEDPIYESEATQSTRDYLYIMTEDISPGRTLDNYLRNIVDVKTDKVSGDATKYYDALRSIFVQVLSSLWYGADKIEFTHWDLHTSNIVAEDHWFYGPRKKWTFNFEAPVYEKVPHPRVPLAAPETEAENEYMHPDCYDYGFPFDQSEDENYNDDDDPASETASLASQQHSSTTYSPLIQSSKTISAFCSSIRNIFSGQGTPSMIKYEDFHQNVDDEGDVRVKDPDDTKTYLQFELRPQSSDNYTFKIIDFGWSRAVHPVSKSLFHSLMLKPKIAKTFNPIADIRTLGFHLIRSIPLAELRRLDYQHSKHVNEQFEQENIATPYGTPPRSSRPITPRGSPLKGPSPPASPNRPKKTEDKYAYMTPTTLYQELKEVLHIMVDWSPTSDIHNAMVQKIDHEFEEYKAAILVKNEDFWWRLPHETGDELDWMERIHVVCHFNPKCKIRSFMETHWLFIMGAPGVDSAAPNEMDEENRYQNELMLTKTRRKILRILNTNLFAPNRTVGGKYLVGSDIQRI